MDHNRWLKPEILHALNDLSLVAKTVVDSFMIGIHPGKKRGTGTEFDQFRIYQPGDDIKRIDWKMYARSDRYYIKESEVETSISVRFIIDTTASMALEEKGYSRLEYASLMAASLGYLSFQQGDAIGLTLINDKEIVSTPLRRDKQQLYRFFNALQEIKPRGVWPDKNKLEMALNNESHRELWILISDFIDTPQILANAVRAMKDMGNEVMLIQVLSDKEFNLPVKGVFRFTDPETGQSIVADSDTIKDSYKNNLNRHLSVLQSLTSDQNHTLFTCSMSDPLDFALVQFLKVRQFV